jgi:hypothetical protein
MPEINNAQLTKFCNEVLRIQSDAIARVDMLIPGIIAEYNAKNLGTVIDSGGAGELITDGSVTDGRTRVVGGDVYNLITLLTDLKAFFDAGGAGRRVVLAKWQVNGLKAKVEVQQG